MAGKHPLDLRIEIADLFDKGVLAGTTPLDRIAVSVGEKPHRTRSAIRALGFEMFKARARIWRQVPTRWAPPRKWPELTRRHRQVTHAVRDLYDTRRVTGRCYAADLAPLVGASEESVVYALKTLRFKVVKKAHKRHAGYESAIYTPPREWDDLFERQRMLRRSGLKADAVIRMTDAAAQLAGIIDRAVRDLDVQNIPLDKRGRLKDSIRKVIEETYHVAERDYIPRMELVKALGASSVDGAEKLLADVQLLRQQANGKELDAAKTVAVLEGEQVALADIAKLDESLMRECVKIMSRRITAQDAISPAAYAIRWVRENHPVA